ncbi:MAG: WD40 repeat domain-containing protein [Gemmataceae bacterium]|jgi:WD40 repeat protein|nr:WD40 repeat domain-containing protein [Gemmataceae bacterium]
MFRLLSTGFLCTALVILAQAQNSPSETKAHGALVHGLAFSPDGKKVASAGFDKNVKIWELTDKGLKEIKVLPHPEPVAAVAWSSDGKFLATGCHDKSVRIFEVADWKQKHELKGHTDTIGALTFSNDNKLLASGGSNADKSVRLWNPVEGKEQKNLGTHGGSIYSLSFSPDDKLLASGGSDLIKIWDVPTQKESKQLKGHELGVTGVVFTENNVLISVSQDRTIRTWDVAGAKESKKLGPTSDDLFALSWAKASKTLGTIGYAGNVRVFDLNKAEPIFATQVRNPGYSVILSNDGKIILSGHDNGTIQIHPVSGMKK